MKTDLLLILANKLENDVPEDGWNFGTWGHQKDTGCGFAGCAMGWASIWPEFVGFNEQVGVPGQLFSVANIAYYFGIDILDAQYLFSPGHNSTHIMYPEWKGEYNRSSITPQMVATAIRKFVGAVPMPEFVVPEKVAVTV